MARQLQRLTISRLLTGPFNRWKPYIAAPMMACADQMQKSNEVVDVRR